MNNVESILYLAALSVSSFCFLQLLLCRRHIKVFPRYLTVLIALHALGFVFQVLLNAPLSPFKHLWMFLAISQAFLVGPVLLLYAREILENKLPAPLDIGGIPSALLLIGVLCVSPVLWLTHAGTDWGSDSRPDATLFWRTYYVLAAVYVVCYFVLSFWCMCRCARLIAGRSILAFSAIRALWADESASARVKVLKIALWGFLISVLINAARVIYCSFVVPTDFVNQLQSLLDISVTVIVLMVSVTKLINAGFVSVDEPSNDQLDRLTKKYERSALSVEAKARIRSKIETALKDEAVFTQNDLTLGKLSELINEKHHYVSQVINQELETSFFALVNVARIHYAQQCLQDDADIAIVDLAERAGFNSKTTFYSAFSKFVGMTPSQYRSSLT